MKTLRWYRANNIILFVDYSIVHIITYFMPLSLNRRMRNDNRRNEKKKSNVRALCNGNEWRQTFDESVWVFHTRSILYRLFNFLLLKCKVLPQNWHFIQFYFCIFFFFSSFFFSLFVVCLFRSPQIAFQFTHFDYHLNVDRARFQFDLLDFCRFFQLSFSLVNFVFLSFKR